MSRQSARKVKLTSKFEEFSTRLASIQRHHEHTTPIKQKAVSTPFVETPTQPQLQQAPTPKLQQTPIPKLQHTPMPKLQQTPMPKLTANGKIRGRPRKCLQKAETVVKPISTTREELLRLRDENASLKVQLEQKNAEFEELRRQSSYTGQTVPKVDFDDLKGKYERDLTHAKRHEWCALCLNPSRYYCCWNTTYCSQKCQVSDWFQRHMKSCERRRALRTVS